MTDSRIQAWEELKASSLKDSEQNAELLFS